MIISAIVLLTIIFVTRYYAKLNALELHQIETREIAQRHALSLESELQKFTLLPKVLSETQYVQGALNILTPELIDELNYKLSSFVEMTGVDYIFVIDKDGSTVASSNYQAPDSFVGKKFAFRPYFQEALTTGDSVYFAKGELTGKAGLFLARKIVTNQVTKGVIVVKVEFSNIVERWKQEQTITFVTNNNNIILFSSDPSLDFSLLEPLADTLHEQILLSKQFGDKPLTLSWLKLDSNNQTTGPFGRSMLASSWPVSELDWQIFHVSDLSPAIESAKTRSLLQILSLSLLVASICVYLSWKVTRDREREKATEYLKKEITIRTKELVSSNTKLVAESKKRDEINTRFRRAREDLAHFNRIGSIGAITASVAHEINQPAGAIKALAQNATKLLLRKDSEQLARNLDSIIILIGKIGVITSELRQYAKRDGRVIGNISLLDVIEGVDLLMGEKLRAVGIEYSIIYDIDKNIEIKGEKVGMEQILVNLLQNALEALETNISPKIELRISAVDKYIAITVDDNGVGIQEEIRSEIFNPFITDKNKGLGIGLGIARDIAAEYGGTLVESTSVLGGAAFTLKLVKV